MGCCTAKYMALAVFVLQNAGVILLMRYSKVHATAQTGYNSAVAVLMCELVKMPACALLLAVERGGVCAFVSSVADDLRTNGREWLQLSLPALLYVVQNNMLFIGLANLEAAVAQVTYQLKIFITALFTVCLLGRRLGAIQWFGLFLLTLGVLCVQGLPEKLAARALNKMAGGASAGGATAVDAESAHATLVGVSAVLVACFCSSFAGGANASLAEAAALHSAHAHALGAVCMPQMPHLPNRAWAVGLSVARCARGGGSQSTLR